MLPSCGSGPVPARAGKALDARGCCAPRVQADCGGSSPGVAGGWPCCAATKDGKAASMPAKSWGLLIVASIEYAILAMQRMKGRYAEAGHPRSTPFEFASNFMSLINCSIGIHATQLA
jgi:hypothetical protein